MRERGVAVEVARLEARPIQQTLVFSGRVAAQARSELAATTTGRVERVRVREGDRVAAGQTLIELEAQELRAQVAQARAALASAQARLRAQGDVNAPVSQQALAQARANLDFARRELDRQKVLFAQGFIGQARLQEAERAAVVAAAALTQAEAQASGNAASGAEVAALQARVREAEAALALAEARLAQTRILAPSAGRILARHVEPGEVVQPARRLLSLAVDGETRVLAQIDEKHLAQLKLGQEARVIADAFPQEPFQATLQYLAPAADATRGTVEVRFLVPKPPAFLRDEMTVSLEVVTANRERALTLPTAALRMFEGQPSVLVFEDGIAKPQAVGVGLRTPQRVEIVTGLREGMRVIIDPTVSPGQKVRPRSEHAGAAR